MRRSRVTRPAAITAIALILVVVGPALAVGAQQRFYQPDERVLVTDGGMLHAVATSPLEVFAAADGAILVRDINRDRWKLPIAYPDGFTARPTALAWDAAGGTLWLGTESGDVMTVAPGVARWDRISIMARGRVEALVASPRDASVYARIAGNWFRIAAGSFFAEIISDGSLPAAVGAFSATTPDDPYFRAARGTLGLDAQGRRWPVTGVAAGRENGEYWIATGGGGLIHYDGITRQQRWMRYGTVGRGVATVARIADRLWFGGMGETRSGVSRTDESLGAWDAYERDDGAPAGFVAEIVGFAGSAWFGASDGLYRLDRPESERATGRGQWSRISTPDGLPSDRVRSLAVAWEMVWAGTDRGLTPFDSTGSAVRSTLFPGLRVSRLSFRNDTLWIATDRGLWSLAATSAAGAARAEPVPAGTSPAYRGRINDVLAGLDVSIAIADGQVFDLAGPGAPFRDAMLDRIGPALRLAAQDGWLWVAGQRGAAYRDPDTHAWQALTVPADVPSGPVLDVLPAGNDVWLATPRGAVRLRWR